jgi:hypothetical protein
MVLRQLAKTENSTKQGMFESRSLGEAGTFYLKAFSRKNIMTKVLNVALSSEFVLAKICIENSGGHFKHLM